MSIQLHDLHHACLRVLDIDEAAARWSIQYQRSRRISTSSTKKSGMPLSKASSTTAGNSKLRLALR